MAVTASCILGFIVKKSRRWLQHPAFAYPAAAGRSVYLFTIKGVELAHPAPGHIPPYAKIQ